MKPVFLIRDPQMVKQITIKDFDYFVDRRTFLSPELDPLFAKALIALEGHKWKSELNICFVVLLAYHSQI